jgi:glycosyltransferase involved in cell wall biosynthesis
MRARPLKLIIQIPCYNEAETLPAVLADIPRRIDGIDEIEILVIDDGSSDGTAELARSLGVDHVLRNTTNLGLARSFQRGLHACLRLGADIVVNTDGDNQYWGGSIPDLVRPIVEGRADVVIGDRRPGERADFSLFKRRLQRIGSWAVRRLSGVAVADAVSGFRAYSREAALSTNVITKFSYTIETLIHAGRRGLAVVSVPVRSGRTDRPSRLFKSIPSFLQNQLITIVRSYTMYRPLRMFGLLGLVMSLVGLFPILRFLYFYAIGDGGGHVQSLILGGMFFALGYVTLVIALLSDTIATNRQMLEATLERVRSMELAIGAQTPPPPARDPAPRDELSAPTPDERSERAERIRAA